MAVNGPRKLSTPRPSRFATEALRWDADSKLTFCFQARSVQHYLPPFNTTNTMSYHQQGPKYDMTLNPVYQVDWQAEAKGKRLSSTKRRVQFRFGFSSAEAIQAGQMGPACRGEEHEVVLTWSLTSGKRTVTYDGKQVHYSKSKSVSDTNFGTTFPIDGGHTVKLIANAVAPMFASDPNFRQYDLVLDGCSFFNMPKIFELGTKTQARRAPTRAVRPVAPRPPASHTRPKAALAPVRAAKAAAVPSTQDLLGDAFGDSNDLVSSNQPPPPPSLPEAPAHDPFSPAATQQSYESVTTSILSAYGCSSAPALAANSQALVPVQSTTSPYALSPVTPQTTVSPTATAPVVNPPNVYSPAPQTPTFQAPHQAPLFPSQQPPITPQQLQYRSEPAHVSGSTSPTSVICPEQPQVQLTMKPLTFDEIETQTASASASSPMEKAVKSLVNLDDIGQSRQSPEQIKYQNNRVVNQHPVSKPLPPTKADWSLGMKPTIGEIKSKAPPKAPPSKEIMRTHAFDPAAVHAGMMVVHGQQPPLMPQPYGLAQYGAPTYHQ